MAKKKPWDEVLDQYRNKENDSEIAKKQGYVVPVDPYLELSAQHSASWNKRKRVSVKFRPSLPPSHSSMEAILRHVDEKHAYDPNGADPGSLNYFEGQEYLKEQSCIYGTPLPERAPALIQKVYVMPANQQVAWRAFFNRIGELIDRRRNWWLYLDENHKEGWDSAQSA